VQGDDARKAAAADHVGKPQRRECGRSVAEQERLVLKMNQVNGVLVEGSPKRLLERPSELPSWNGGGFLWVRLALT
jgi:hypothetical protein